MSLPPIIPQEALQALREGKLIDAIKITRERTGLGLKESKDLIDQYLKDHPHEQAQIQQQLAQHSRGGIKFFVLLFVIIALLFWFVAK
ncbi:MULTISPECIES: ribosomal protein L7/L12 [Acinetobacter]|uniref:ribosomal protein L7/L12 n=1 Tax=Acinetobacter TaxID=469 RepID=UPI00244A92D8|nr:MULTISPECIES: ribosomal protein L7/L12 [Acinetobacter]MDH0030400.1 ribosomal protein L7/L12 [Acinetobacter sp. GD04021]MDH0885711.1 ribosomal protein L7/L12 [Acinetobacter sp. GD03873]MDH1081973.1 ribosomal protein L7/L12 [Acinetobacter sp. GD03983]MDH2188997.1 ribosomal protein L7/L12 [Acinetobacter sp. GD03645]MDH2202442.1 ribosomal protein L7/L12 [Acinetobacter sp. GD03647]